MEFNSHSCPNKACRDHGKTGEGNISMYTRYGRKQVQLLICSTCGKTFSELKGTCFWDSRLSWESIVKIYGSLLEGSGIRAAARLHKLSKNTVKRYLRFAGKNRENFCQVIELLAKQGIQTSGMALRQRLHDLGNGRAHYLHHTIDVEWIASGMKVNHHTAHAHHPHPAAQHQPTEARA